MMDKKKKKTPTYTMTLNQDFQLASNLIYLSSQRRA